MTTSQARWRVLALGITIALQSAVRADNWPAWRGPTGQGHCSETNLPLKWSTRENVKWKVAMPAPGNSTPITWGDKIFITQSNKACTKRGLMCLDRAEGKLLWHQEIDYAAKETGVNLRPVGAGERPAGHVDALELSS